MTDEKRTVMENVAKMFAERSPEEKAFLLGYMVAKEQERQTRQQVATA